MTETIYARASGAGRAGVAVFRLSGPEAQDLASKVLGSQSLPPPRYGGLRRVIRPESGDLIDEGLVLFFPGPNSFTGEDVVEFQLHGSLAVEKAFYETMAALGARAAEPGEFTRRALINGRLDLARVEGLADLLEAETNQQRILALGQYSGRLSTIAEGWRDRLVMALAPLEAEIDFPDEEDVPAGISAASRARIEALVAELDEFLERADQGRIIRNGFDVAIIGAPNAGKSSILNRLAGDERAIVSDVPGTTRDIIEVRLDIGGVPVTIADTAGLRDQSTDEIEQEGMRRTRARAAVADLRILVIDASAPDVSRETFAAGIVSCEGAPELRDDDLILLNKTDLGGVSLSQGLEAGLQILAVSAKTGAGFDDLLGTLQGLINERLDGTTDCLLTRGRHVEAVARAKGFLQACLADNHMSPEISGENIRLAARALGEITGAVEVEAVLGAIFSSFCIGK